MPGHERSCTAADGRACMQAGRPARSCRRQVARSLNPSSHPLSLSVVMVTAPAREYGRIMNTLNSKAETCSFGKGTREGNAFWPELSLGLSTSFVRNGYVSIARCSNCRTNKVSAYGMAPGGEARGPWEPKPRSVR